MIRLAAGGWRAAVLPGSGAAFASLSLDGHDVLVPLPEGADPNATRAGAFLMLPWCNRLGDGRLTWPGGEHRFPINDLAGGNAIHGLSRAHPWRVVQARDAALRLEQRLDAPGQPYRYDAWFEVSLSAGQLRLRLGVTNAASQAMPFGCGWHPWFHRDAAARLRLRATTLLVVDGRGLPVRALPSEGLSGGSEAWLGQDLQFAGWDGEAALDLGPARLHLRTEGAWTRCAQVFAPEAAPVLCVEPVSHVTDVVNRPQFAASGGMALLRPGETLEAGLTLSARS